MKSTIQIFLSLFISTLAIVSCNSDSDDNKSTTTTETTSADTSNKTPAAPSTDDGSNQGIGKFKNVELTHPLDQKMVASGKTVYDLKCASCHKLSEEKLVGPGWKGVTDRRTPEWIMNFVTNTDEMIAKDAAAKNLYEVCLVKMPNQNLTDDDARHVLEFIRNNDGKN